jgi:site-specific DNA-methyltransferase (adenine-specific)
LAENHPALTDYIVSVGVIRDKSMAAYLTYMAQRIIEMHRILKDTGSLYLHCDQTASHFLKGVLDEIFGKNNFRNEIIWCYRKWTNTIKSFQRNHDIILFYTKSDKFTFNRLIDENAVGAHYAKGYHTNTVKTGESQLIVYDKEKATHLIESGKYDKIVYRENAEGVIMPDWWEISFLNSQAKERTGYPTQKPLALLQRIIQASSNEGDIVLDPFCGCATTCVAAQQLGRKWTGIDIEKQAVDVLVDRLSSDAGMFKDFINTDKIPQRTDVQVVEPTKAIKERLYKEQEGRCNGCGTEFDLWNLEIDRKIPRAKGGADIYENYQLLCGSCNRIKGDRPMEYLRLKIATRKRMMKEKLVFGE